MNFHRTPATRFKRENSRFEPSKRLSTKTNQQIGFKLECYISEASILSRHISFSLIGSVYSLPVAIKAKKSVRSRRNLLLQKLIKTDRHEISTELQSHRDWPLTQISTLLIQMVRLEARGNEKFTFSTFKMTFPLN